MASKIDALCLEKRPTISAKFQLKHKLNSHYIITDLVILMSLKLQILMQNQTINPLIKLNRYIKFILQKVYNKRKFLNADEQKTSSFVALLV
jgi:hypothetical protein